MRRSVLALLASGVAVAALVTSGPASARAALHAPQGAGYVVSPSAVKSASLVATVPRLACGKSATYTVATGLYGYVRESGREVPWSLTIDAHCLNGKPGYKVLSSDGVAPPEMEFTVRPGDRVFLHRTSAQNYEAKDLTSGEEAGGGSAGSGPKPVLRTTMLFGTRVTGKPVAATQIPISLARVNGAAIGTVAHRVQQQTDGHTTVARAGVLHTKNAFGIAVAKSAGPNDGAPIGGGYVAAPKAVRSASATVVVPRLSCAKSASYSVAIGLFGFTVRKGDQARWSVAVVAACSHGVTKYRAGNTDRPGGGLVVRPGDHVVLTRPSATEFAVADRETGKGMGGSQTVIAPAPTLRTTMLVGVRVSGPVPAARSIVVTAAKINGAPLNSVAHSAQRQTSAAGTVAARPGPLHAGGAFTVAVPRR